MPSAFELPLNFEHPVAVTDGRTSKGAAVTGCSKAKVPRSELPEPRFCPEGKQKIGPADPNDW